MTDGQPPCNPRDTERAVRRLLAAIGSRDVRAIAASLSHDVTWQNVPERPATGRNEVVALLGPIVTWSDDVRWDVISESYGAGVAWLERADRFWIDGHEHTVRCNGVFTVRVGGVSGVRDYVDLGEWRTRIGPVLDRLTVRSPMDVVERHLRAVRRLEIVAMSADYAVDARLVRGHEQFDGIASIAGYFDTVPSRLGDATLDFGMIRATHDGAVSVPWTLTTGTSMRASGFDTYIVERGRITHQTVALDGADF